MVEELNCNICKKIFNDIEKYEKYEKHNRLSRCKVEFLENKIVNLLTIQDTLNDKIHNKDSKIEQCNKKIQELIEEINTLKKGRTSMSVVGIASTMISNKQEILNLSIMTDEVKENIKNLLNTTYNIEYILEGQPGLIKCLSENKILIDPISNIPYYVYTKTGKFKYKVDVDTILTDENGVDIINLIEPIIKNKLDEIGYPTISDYATEGSKPGTSNNHYLTKASKLLDSITSIRCIKNDSRQFTKALSKIISVKP